MGRGCTPTQRTLLHSRSHVILASYQSNAEWVGIAVALIFLFLITNFVVLMSKTHESPSHKGSCPRRAKLQGIKSPAVPGRGLWLPAGGEQVDGRRVRAELQQLSLLGASSVASVAAGASAQPAPLNGEHFSLPLAGQEELVPLGLSRGAKLEC